MGSDSNPVNPNEPFGNDSGSAAPGFAHCNPSCSSWLCPVRPPGDSSLSHLLCQPTAVPDT